MTKSRGGPTFAAVAPVESQLAMQTYTYWRSAQAVEASYIDAMANLTLNQLAQNGLTVSLRLAAIKTLSRTARELSRT